MPRVVIATEELYPFYEVLQEQDMTDPGDQRCFLQESIEITDQLLQRYLRNMEEFKEIQKLLCKKESV